MLLSREPKPAPVEVPAGPETELVAESITPTLIEYQKIQKWNGELPQVSGAGSGILLNMERK